MSKAHKMTREDAMINRSLGGDMMRSLRPYYWALRNVLRNTNRVLEWDPSKIFYSTTTKLRSYDTPEVEGSLFGPTIRHGSFSYTWHYTKLGKFMDALPGGIEMILVGVYYVIAWPLWLCIKIPWGVFCLIFVPQNWL